MKPTLKTLYTIFAQMIKNKILFKNDRKSIMVKNDKKSIQVKTDQKEILENEQKSL